MPCWPCCFRLHCRLVSLHEYHFHNRPPLMNGEAAVRSWAALCACRQRLLTGWAGSSLRATLAPCWWHLRSLFWAYCGARLVTWQHQRQRTSSSMGSLSSGELSICAEGSEQYPVCEHSLRSCSLQHRELLSYSSANAVLCHWSAWEQSVSRDSTCVALCCCHLKGVHNMPQAQEFAAAASDA